jgi:hypothetical protein
MYKPKKTITPKSGSKTETILKFLLGTGGNADYKSYIEIADTITDATGVVINRRVVCNAVLRYNEGLFIVDGKTVEDTGKLSPLDKKPKASQDLNTSYGCTDSVSNIEHDESIDVVIDEESSNPEDVKTFKQICIEEGIDPADAAGGWVKTKNLSVRIKTKEDTSDELGKLLDAAEELINKDFWHVAPRLKAKGSNIGVVHISDLHLGAWVKGLVKTPDYDLNILKNKLLDAVDTVNAMGYAEVHVNCYGDLIEGFGSNHPNSWKEMENGIHGVEAIKLVHQVFTEFFLDRINNIAKVNMVGGNHDRTTENNKEDTKGGVADLVAAMLRLSGYDVTFSPLVVPVEIDGIMYIMLHGDKGVSKRSTSDIICSYGKLKKPVIEHGKIVEKKMFNFVLEGHLHSRIQRMSAGAIDKFKIVTDDSIDMRRQVLPSIFTGNSYSEDNNWFSNSGIVITHNNGRGVPCVLDLPI